MLSLSFYYKMLSFSFYYKMLSLSFYYNMAYKPPAALCACACVWVGGVVKKFRKVFAGWGVRNFYFV